MPQHTREGAYDHQPEPAHVSWSGSWMGGLIGFGLLLATLVATYAIYTREGAREAVAKNADHVGAHTAAAAFTPADQHPIIASSGEVPPEAAAPGEPGPAAPGIAPPPRTEAPAGGFRVPQPGDPEYADYREMLKQPMFRSSVENTAGYAPPYDPEWRSVMAGRREVGPINLDFVNAAGSIEELGRFVVLAALEEDGPALLSLAVNQPEFESILWPEFPQSRPYLRIPPSDAWAFHYGDLTKGITRGGLALRNKPYTFAGIRSGGAREYANFRLLEGVVLTCRDESTGRIEEFDFIGVIAERNGRFKVYSYKE